MQCFADLHAHILCGVDDGAKSLEDMYVMLDAAYASGTRVLCATPHYHPGLFEHTNARSQAAFEQLKAHAAQYSDLTLFLANELRYEPGCVAWLQSGDCRTLAGGTHVLVDFKRAEPEMQITNGLKTLLSAGYRPILAHAELYPALRLKTVEELAEDGVLIQIDANSALGAFGLRARFRSRYLLKHRLAVFAASDMHDPVHRPPSLIPAYEFAAKQYGRQYANEIFYENALQLLQTGRNTDHESECE